MAINLFKQGKRTLTDWRKHPALQEARTRLDQLDRDHPALRHAAEEADRQVQAAQEALDDVEGLFLIGRATDQEVKAAKAHLEDARKAAAQARYDLAENRRHAAIMVPGHAQLQHEAKLAAIDALRSDYRQAVRALQEALETAVTLNAEVDRIHGAAAAQFPGYGVEPEYPMCAGLPQLAWHELKPNHAGGPGGGAFIETRLGRWTAEAKAFLEDRA